MNQQVPDLVEPIRQPYVPAYTAAEDLMLAHWFRVYGEDIVLEGLRMVKGTYNISNAFKDSVKEGLEALPPRIRNTLKLRT